MSERLTDKRIAHGGFIEYKNYDKFAKLPNVREIYDRLCDLEDKIEQGKIVELPCRVGQTVYRITNFIYGETLIVEGEVFEFTITNEYGNKVKNRFYFYAKGGKFDRRVYSLWCDFDEFGKTVFLDRAAAEAKLREMEGDNNE